MIGLRELDMGRVLRIGCRIERWRQGRQLEQVRLRGSLAPNYSPGQTFHRFVRDESILYQLTTRLHLLVHPRPDIGKQPLLFPCEHISDCRLMALRRLVKVFLFHIARPVPESVFLLGLTKLVDAGNSKWSAIFPLDVIECEFAERAGDTRIGYRGMLAHLATGDHLVGAPASCVGGGGCAAVEAGFSHRGRISFMGCCGLHDFM